MLLLSTVNTGYLHCTEINMAGNMWVASELIWHHLLREHRVYVFNIWVPSYVNLYVQRVTDRRVGMTDVNLL